MTQSQIIQIFKVADYRQDVARGAELLSAGKLVVLPTETSYGVAAAVTHSASRAALREIRKDRQANKPFTLHIARPGDALDYLAEDVNDFARRMMRKLWPGPVGLAFEVAAQRQKEVAERLDLEIGELYSDSKITIRCPDDPVFFDVVSQVADPVALTAAGGGWHSVADIDPEILNRAEMVLDAGKTRLARPSTLVRVGQNNYEIIREGMYDQRIIDRLLKTTILFVCSGNTCRSPMAETIAKKILADQLKVSPDELEKKGIFVTSAGAYAIPGAAATPQAVSALDGMGYDLSRHRSRPLTVDLIHQADVIYTMAKSHTRAVEAMVPTAADKVSQLDPDRDIEDPIGGDVSLYVETANQLKALIEKRLKDEISKLA